MLSHRGSLLLRREGVLKYEVVRLSSVLHETTYAFPQSVSHQTIYVYVSGSPEAVSSRIPVIRQPPKATYPRRELVDLPRLARQKWRSLLYRAPNLQTPPGSTSRAVYRSSS